MAECGVRGGGGGEILGGVAVVRVAGVRESRKS
jgi:hypothetical protein